jgi:phosphoserine aminotransferase
VVGFISIYQEAQADFRRLMGVPENYRVLFLRGGGLGEKRHRCR